jgi:EAL and modified HD-GYP domain-containing signal transduction protein
MATLATETNYPLTAQPQLPAEMRYVARQPILDLQNRIHGYDLLFRHTPEAVFRQDSEMGIETMLDNEVLFGLERFTNGLPAFITCTAEALAEGWVLVLVPSLTVLGVSANFEPTPGLIDACETLRSRGFRLALNDYSRHDPAHPLLEQADYLRLDFRRYTRHEELQLLRSAQKSVIRVAQNVNSEEDRHKACDLGFTLFQGDYFCHPVLFKKRKVPTNSLSHFEIVRELYHDPINIHKVSDLVRRDASLTYRLLRLVNSPIYGIYREIRSIESAITVLGEATFRRIVSLAVISELNREQPAAILQFALVRARFCELAARDCGLDPAEQYLLGMLSLLPAMLGVPMEEIVPMLPLRGQICEALAGTINAEGKLLAWLLSHERGDWASCDLIVKAHHLDPKKLLHSYLDAVSWAEAPVNS